MWKNWFAFTRKERTGIWILLTLLILIFGLAFTTKLSDRQTEEFNFAGLKAEVDTFLAHVEENPNYGENRLNRYIIARYDTLDLFEFDPNTTTEKQWKKLGLTDKQTRTIMNYRRHGGKFFVKDDFRKIYGIRHKQYQILKPYIRLPEKEKPDYQSENFSAPQQAEYFPFDPNTASARDWQRMGFSQRQIQTIENYKRSGGRFFQKQDVRKLYCVSDQKYEKLKPYIQIEQSWDSPQGEKTENTADNFVVELNSATPAELKKLRGVGDYFAGKIVKYRSLLGGFSSKTQLLEVYNFKKETYEAIKNQVRVDKSRLKKLNINFADYGELIGHPYLKKSHVKAILNHRSQNGSYASVSEVLENGLMPEKDFRKIKPYLKVRN